MISERVNYPTKPLSWYRDNTPLKWDVSDEVCTFVYTADGEQRIDIFKLGAQKDQVISLKMTQFETLFHITPMVCSSVRKTCQFKYDLGGMVYITYEEFRKRWTVNIRQYYINEVGDEAPGKWGVNLAPDVWRIMSRATFKTICKYSHLQTTSNTLFCYVYRYFVCAEQESKLHECMGG